jgi:hexosaminidase
MESTLDCLIPVPESICYVTGNFDCSKLVSVFYKDEPSLIIDRLVEEAAFFGVNLSVKKDNPSIKLELDNKLDREAFRMTITPLDITISSGSEDGLRYGVSALIQLIAIAFIKGPVGAVIPCGEINDKPRFKWRGFLLDSSRHFHDANHVIKILNIMSHLRLNVLHLHLTDSQGWRIQIETLKGLEAEYSNTPGFYSKSDIRRIVEFAQSLGIKIVPEIDIPGHSKLLLKHYPQFACDPENPGTEICLANLEARETLKKVLLEVFEMFPYSDLIHLGGDEVLTTVWEECEDCKNKMKELGTLRPDSTSKINSISTNLSVAKVIMELVKVSCTYVPPS